MQEKMNCSGNADTSQHLWVTCGEACRRGKGRKSLPTERTFKSAEGFEWLAGLPENAVACL